MTDDSTSHDGDHDGDASSDASDASDASDGATHGPFDDPVDAEPDPNGAGPEPADQAGGSDSASDGSGTDDAPTDDAPPDPIVGDVASDPSPDARPRADAPEPPDGDGHGSSGLDGPIPTEVDVEEAFEPHERTPEAEPADTPDERIVPKRTYCERCEHFERPPEVGCTHDGTRIVEMVDRRHFRVVNCPVVAEREELAADEGAGREPELDDDEHWRGDVGPK